jgi:hypothetical protein
MARPCCQTERHLWWGGESIRLELERCDWRTVALQVRRCSSNAKICQYWLDSRYVCHKAAVVRVVELSLC